MDGSTGPAESRKMEIRRASDAKDLMTAMFLGDMDETNIQGMAKVAGPDYRLGHFVKILFASEEMGLSLTYSWFKPGFPLPRHSHSADCLYYVVSGEMLMGDDTLGAGDTIFVPEGSLYTFETGPSGLEFIEFRKTARYDIKFNAQAKAWDRQAQQIRDNVETWKVTEPPMAVRRMTGQA